ncbi:acyltransferase [Salmonella enterica subsp. houtenae serovar 50:g,z51:- str. 01-0133]|nr:hypothetical protein SEHO0A_01596 [Salmonella enterica subsp. houtenae str. ATCC BAA-1581]ENZ86856.1 1-acyl-sn-glycerol-3-phosphate acyltransferase [Salmonella enterica subsp. houtenae serovar 16:z4,z32:-- str. RKS3027]ESE83094.1 acyltransferase [Salmonella enterica subsp. houtenae serovar 50:g,z51:- str. 01-0133]
MNPLALCEQALRDNKILILFPEGTRGEPETPFLSYCLVSLFAE